MSSAPITSPLAVEEIGSQGRVDGDHIATADAASAGMGVGRNAPPAEYAEQQDEARQNPKSALHDFSFDQQVDHLDATRPFAARQR